VPDYVTPDELAAQLGLRDSTAPRLARVCTGVSDDIDATLGVEARLNPVPATVAEVALALAVDTWKQPDATFAIIGLNETGAVRVPRDLMARYVDRLVNYFTPGAWGVA